MGFAVMTMTESAADRVKAIVGNSGPDAKGVRVGIKKGGCAGMEYTIDMVTEANPKDDLIERDGAKVWIEPSAVLYLLGTEMGFETTTLRSGFTFTNPNQTSACGCGESVELKPADLAALASQREASVAAI
ncbi:MULTISPECIES: Fe-S cluster assembly scaffold SufA [Rhizobium]|uniref:Fe-S cluster assembly scaffold SufA n=1 Tax=Rhizobium rhododendri TaxID=2506430 RepID=A0ABY8IMP9_9HYPH|nr:MULTISPECIES: Fe-S cluster assembly scaffold SufA [Rhizobium]MBZ5758144.1 Fe-S cluster assembly scaffold SufA [Rhizobium sp. VS19-DR96]MBZ5765026.1 Fe-S cluster assembly scaffold SufA [Rhizobium sp. VS19-DR129.2]MBZ5772569.1 Fe-S cluster assembly scaffold SufA [Rhizobium sp. VS19-DRK62.2]MBZ5782744.1 Fe-S cluster assembly scaffold SufA [Rhizobium sp. VS19-DR121]MBZ5800192.1 Fe-S cluster assembly scaffold SufA [Rhizobium sp. VS19-DR181]